MNGPPPATIPGRILANAAAAPDRPAVVSHGRPVSYADFAAQLGRMIAWLDRQGVEPGLTVGIVVRDEIDHFLASLALLRLGCRQFSVAVSETAAWREDMARRCGASLILAEDTRFAVPDAAILVPPFDDIRADRTLTPRTLPPEDPTVPQMYFTSSGTTGRPKIAPVSQAQILTYSWHREVTASIGTVFRVSHMEYDTPRRQHYKAISLGITTVLCDPDAYAHPGEACFRHGVNLLVLAPSQVRRLVELPVVRDGRRLPRGIRVVASGAEVTGPVRQAALRHLADDVHVTYGTTECGSIAFHQCRLDDQDATRVGRLFSGVDIRIADADGQPVPKGAVGRIGIRTPGMVTRYHDDPEATERCFQDGWFVPGDLVAFDGDGILQYHGRADDMMILNNLNIHPSEIERFVDAQPGVVECAAFPLRSPVHGDIPVVAVVAREGFDRGALIREAREVLGVRSPRRIFEIEALPRNAMGKILRRELAEWARGKGGQANVA